jgi:hypothetical protein
MGQGFAGDLVARYGIWGTGYGGFGLWIWEFGICVWVPGVVDMGEWSRSMVWPGWEH